MHHVIIKNARVNTNTCVVPGTLRALQFLSSALVI